MKIILSTRNPTKAEQIRALFVGSPFRLLTLEDADIEGDAIEDGGTLLDNATIKAEYAFERANFMAWAMADDTGLFIYTLNGKPGVKSARWAGEDVPETVTMNYCLERMKNVKDRSAKFITSVVVITPDGKDYSFTGEVRGHLLESPRVAPQPKMPYSALFVPEGTNKVWAEMSVEEENTISHRGKAFRAAREFIERYSG